MPDELVSLWDADDGAAARCYAEKPYGHYKEEVYPLFGEILDAMGDGIRVLDIGAGPGHLAVEFHKARPGSAVRFALVDIGQAMLDIAADRLAALGVRAECFRRSFNQPGWHEGLGAADAIVSNNAVFHVRPERLADFYRECFGLLNPDGLLLNQQSFAHDHAEFGEALEGFPEVLSPLRQMSAAEATRAARLRPEAERLNAEAAKGRDERAASLRAGGRKVESDVAAYAGARLTAATHLACLRDAGFAAGCIWRKMEFAVLVGIKGKPFRRGERS